LPNVSLLAPRILERRRESEAALREEPLRVIRVGSGLFAFGGIADMNS